MFKDNAERAGAKFIDIFDDFADQSGGFDAFGPNVEGQKVKLRGSDGIHLTPAGGKKLAHFLEAEVLSALGETAPPPQTDIAALPPDIGKATDDINEQIRREMGEPSAPVEAARPPSRKRSPRLPPRRQRRRSRRPGAIASLAARPASPGCAGSCRRARARERRPRRCARGEPPPAEPGRADDFTR